MYMTIFNLNLNRVLKIRMFISKLCFGSFLV